MTSAAPDGTATTEDPCIACGGVGPFERFELREMLFGTRESFSYLLCPTCGLMRIEHVPADLARHYPAAYYGGPPPPLGPARGWLGRQADRARDRQAALGTDGPIGGFLRGRAAPMPPDLRASAKLVKRAGLRSFDDPILDVGCGRIPGQLIRLRRLGFTNLLGVDPFLEEDSEVDGVPLRRRSIHEVEGDFALITMHHSFEHVPDPVETLRSATRLLRPDGALVIRTPVMGTWFWETFGTAWWELDPPRHLFVFSQASLERLAGAAGLTLMDIAWDSTPQEIIASEQIQQDIAWREPASWNEPGVFDPDLEARATAQVRALNAEGRAGRAGFTFKRAGHAAAGDRPKTASVTAYGAKPGPVRSVLRRVRRAVAGPGPAGAARAAAAPPKPWTEDRVKERIRVDFRPSPDRGHRLNLLVPSIQPDLVFGGIQTALDLFAAIGASSERRRIVTLGPLDETVAARWPDYSLSAPGEDPDEPRQLVSIAGEDARLSVGPGDVFVATFWTTAELAIRIAAWQAETFGASPGRFGYLIQDFEPGFYPWSANHVLALATYRAPISTVAIFNTELLRGYVHDQGLRFDHEFAFEPRLTGGLRTALASPADAPRERRIVLYGRPRTPRNAFPLLVEALRAWRSREPAESDWTVVSVGQQHPDIDLGGGTIVRSLGKLDLAAYGELMRGSAIGLSFMVSPHPSYPPLEMAHFGMLVLTNRFASKDLSTWHSNITSADDLSIEGVADALARLCRRVEVDPGAGDRGVSAMTDYLSAEPQFPFAAEVSALLGPTDGPAASLTA